MESIDGVGGRAVKKAVSKCRIIQRRWSANAEEKLEISTSGKLGFQMRNKRNKIH